MTNFLEVSEEINRIANSLDDTKKIAIAGVMAVDFIRDHIYQGEGFAPLSPATEAYRKSGRPLQDTGHLRDSITYEQINNNTVSIGTTLKYAAIQNNGGTITAKKDWLFIPAKGTRALERRYGKAPGQVLKGLRSDGYSVWRAGRTICYRKKSKRAQSHTAYYLKKSVVIPKRKFFYLTDKEIEQIKSEVLK